MHLLQPIEKGAFKSTFAPHTNVSQSLPTKPKPQKSDKKLKIEVSQDKENKRRDSRQKYVESVQKAYQD